jgi:predicted alpha/beta superfamily hydrolase
MKRITPLLRGTSWLLLAGIFSQSLRAQTKDSIYSHVLQQNRHLEIILPPGGLKQGAKYDVFYVLDGEWNMTIVRPIIDFLVNEGMIPPQIMVSVLNGEPNLRDRDFTPTHTADNPASGKADNFVRFLKNELQPYIGQNYPVSGYTTLFGHSFGGLFGMYALLKEPGLFKSYILADPSFWWDGHYMYPLTTSILTQAERRQVSLFILGRKGDGSQQMDAAGMDSVLRALPASTLNWKIISSPGKSHNSTKLRALVEGLRFTYKGYIGSPLLINPTNGGFVLPGQAFTLYCFNNFTDPLHYRTDGNLPDETSPQLHSKNQVAITHPTDLIVRTLTTRPELEAIVKEHFEIGAVIKAAAKPNGVWLPSKTFTLNQLQADAVGWKKFDAYMEIKQTGYYNLQVMGARAIRWYMNTQLLFRADSAAANGRYQSVIVPLEVGYYAVHIEVKAQHKGEDAVLLYNTPASGDNGLGLLSDLLFLQTTKIKK